MRDRDQGSLWVLVGFVLGAIVAGLLLWCPTAYGATYSLDDTATVVVLHPDSLDALESLVSSCVASSVASATAGLEVTATVSGYTGDPLSVAGFGSAFEVLFGLFLGMVFLVFAAGLLVAKLVSP